MPLPNIAGVWLHKPTETEIDIYPLDPCGGVLCLWGPDVGHGYTSQADTQGCWDSDEWQGHIPAMRYDGAPDAWELLAPSNAKSTGSVCRERGEMTEQVTVGFGDIDGVASALDDELCAAAVPPVPILQTKDCRKKRNPKCLGWPRCGCILQGRQSDCANLTCGW